ncbi:hypothetical protein GCM10028775_13930 [Catellatospora paridis]
MAEDVHPTIAVICSSADCPHVREGGTGRIRTGVLRIDVRRDDFCATAPLGQQCSADHGGAQSALRLAQTSTAQQATSPAPPVM